MSVFKKYIKNYWKPFLLALMFLTFEAVGDLLQPTIMSKIVDIGVANKDMNYVLKMGALMLLVTLFGAVSATIRNIVSSNVSQNFGTELRGDMFKKVQKLSLEKIDKFEKASLITRLTNDINQVQGFFHGTMRIFVKAPIVCIGSLVMATILNPKLSIIIFAVVVIVSIIIYTSMTVGYPFFTRVQKALDKVNGVMREYLSGVRVVKAFNRFDYEIQRFEGVNEELACQSTRANRVMAVFNPGITFTVNIGIVVVLWIGGLRVNHGEMKVGQIIAFINYMTQVLFSLMVISRVFMMFVRARASAERISEVLAEEISNEEKKNTVEIRDLKGRIDFENTTFFYNKEGGEPAVKNVNFSILPGENIGIIGPTGSGKSTLVNLILRFYDATSGTVKIDGVDIKNIAAHSLREEIAYVPQKSVLFTGTILDNLLWGKGDAAMEEIIEAAKVAQAHGFIESFKEGYETQLGQGGINLSGGQKQRISIARALIRKPKIIVLDDCTSAVDMTTEIKIREGLKEYSEDTTCITIAQRITSVMNADKIIVLDNGEAVGIGTHAELLETCSIYMDIFRSQIGEELM
jgi:ATP-binding cassette subfamily B protein